MARQTKAAEVQPEMGLSDERRKKRRNGKAVIRKRLKRARATNTTTAALREILLKHVTERRVLRYISDHDQLGPVS